MARISGVRKTKQIAVYTHAIKIDSAREKPQSASDSILGGSNNIRRSNHTRSLIKHLVLADCWVNAGKYWPHIYGLFTLRKFALN